MNNPAKEHWRVVQWILEYCIGIASHELCLLGSNTILHGYVDADMAGDKDSRRSTTGYVFTVGGTIVIWISKLQHVFSIQNNRIEYYN